MGGAQDSLETGLSAQAHANWQRDKAATPSMAPCVLSPRHITYCGCLGSGHLWDLGLKIKGKQDCDISLEFCVLGLYLDSSLQGPKYILWQGLVAAMKIIAMWAWPK